MPREGHLLKLKPWRLELDVDTNGHVGHVAARIAWATKCRTCVVGVQAINCIDANGFVIAILGTQAQQSAAQARCRTSCATVQCTCARTTTGIVHGQVQG